MDWRLLVIGIAIAAIGGFTTWRFRRPSISGVTPAGCVRAFGILVLAIGILAIPFAFRLKG